MAERADVSMKFVLASIFFCFCVRKSCFVTSDGISITLWKEDAGNINESYAFSSLWITSKHRQPGLTTRNRSCIILLLLCGDIEHNPGPTDIFQKKGIKIVHQNIRSLFHNLTNLICFLDENKNIDIIALTETHICNETYNNTNGLYNIPGYTFEKKNRRKGKGGGVGVYISDRLNWVRRKDLENDETECLFIEVKLKNSKNVIVGCLYRPPDGSLYLNKNFNDIFQDVLSAVNETLLETIILGDVNANYLKRNDSRELKEIIATAGFKQLITEPTRVTENTKTLIDVILTNNENAISSVAVIPLGLSDHDMIACTRKINHQKFSSRTIKCRNYKNYNPNKLMDDIASHDMDAIYEIKDVNAAWGYLRNIIATCFNKNAPIICKRVKGRHCPWLTEELKTKIHRKERLLRKARKSKLTADWEKYKTERNKSNNAVNSAKQTYHQNLLQENQQSPRKFWQLIKQIFPCTKQKSASRSSTAENTTLANKFCKYFATIANRLKEKMFPLRDFVWSKVTTTKKTDKIFVFGYVSNIFVQNQLKSLQRNKAAGIDDLPPGLLKDVRTKIARPLTYIINLSLRTGVVPSDWKIARVTPIHKGGTIDESNYRPISILPVLSKILERAAHQQLSNYMEENDLLSTKQFGYRKKRSTELASLLLTDNIRKSIDKGNLVGALYIDLSKAFDTLGHSILLSKLKSYGIRGKASEWFTDYLFHRRQICIINDVTSEATAVTCGVPQGSILGPLLFLIHLNDFELCLAHSDIILFADDTVVYTAGKTIEEIERKLNSDLKNVADYLAENELIINLKKGKTESMLFGTAKRLSINHPELKLNYKGVNINSTTEYKYLGTVLDKTLSMNTNFNLTYKKASSKLRLLNALKRHLTIKAVEKVYKSMILPCILFNCSMQLNLNDSKQQKLSSLDRRVASLLPRKQPKIINDINRHVVLLVRKCLEGLTCENFTKYFAIQNHTKHTRNNNAMLQIPKVKLQIGKLGFYSMGVKMYNTLPLNLRKKESYQLFRKSLFTHFQNL